METNRPRRWDNVEGNFDFESLISKLFGAEINAIATSRAESPSAARDPVVYQRAVEQAAHARRAADMVPFEFLPADLPAGADAILFHERLHYWQILSCPTLQMQFINYLDNLRSQIAAVGGTPWYVCGQKMGDEQVPPALLDQFIASADADFRVHDYSVPIEEFEEAARSKLGRLVKGSDRIATPSDDATPLPTYQLFMMLPHSPGKDLPAYGALMTFPDSDRVSVFPFNGRYLVESAAWLAQELYEGRPPSRPVSLDSVEDEVYLGTWEFWCRLHGHRYEREEDLASAFLAVMDLAITSDVVEIEPTDGEYTFEMTSIPFRFGKLAFRLQGIDPFRRADGEDPAEAVARFQARVCDWNGWPPPDYPIRKMAAYLTFLLLRACARHIDPTPEIAELLRGLFGEVAQSDSAFGRLAGRLEDLEPAWDLFRYEEDKAPSLGQLVLGNMLNACLYRIRHPGEFALPHLYYARIREAFPLPLTLYDGKYYADLRAGIGPGWPYPTDATRTVHDLIALMAVKPLSRGGSRECGFLDEAIDCWYIRSGLGCPLRGLTPEQAEVREETGLDDWCHWTLRSVLLRTAPEEVQVRWRQRYMQAGGPPNDG